MGQETGLTIKAVAELTGVSLHTLRAWERRYGIPRPDRSARNRYRLYNQQDIADVLWMKQQVESGVSPAQASAVLLRRNLEPTTAVASGAAPLAQLQTTLLEALVARDEGAARQVLDEAWSAFAPEQVLLQVIQPALNEIGDRWQQNLLSVEQEHFASNLVRQRLHALIQAQPSPRFNAPRVIAACAPAEQHDLGLLMFALLARRAGYNVVYLGQRTPLADLYPLARGARAVVISASTVTGLASLIALWNAPLPPAPLLFAGQLFNQVPELRDRMPGDFLGADCVDSVRRLEVATMPQPIHRPARRLLSAAHALTWARLHIVHETVNRYISTAPLRSAAARESVRDELNDAGFYLTEALISALAFDAPALMDAQGSWAASFLPAHNVSHAALHHFLNLYRTACEQSLEADSFKPIAALLARLTSAIPTQESI